MLNSLVSRAAIKSRSRAVAVKRERNNLLNEVAELKRNLMETAFEREKMLNALILCSDALLVSTTALPVKIEKWFYRHNKRRARQLETNKY